LAPRTLNISNQNNNKHGDLNISNRKTKKEYDLWLEEDAAHDSTTGLDGQVFDWGHARREGYCNSPAHFHGGHAPLGRAVLQGPLWQP